MFSCIFVTFPYGVPGQVWHLIDQFLIFAFLLTLIVTFKKGFVHDYYEGLKYEHFVNEIPSW